MLRHTLPTLLTLTLLLPDPVAAGPAPGETPPTATTDGEAVDSEARQRARAHAERADKAFALGRFEAALRAWEAAYQEVPEHTLLFNIAQCHRHLDNLDEAIFAYEKYLYHVPDAGNRDQVERTITRLERERDRRAAARPDLIAVSPPPDRDSPPIYRRWWFIAGSVVVVGATAAIIATASGDELPDSDLGVFDFRK